MEGADKVIFERSGTNLFVAESQCEKTCIDHSSSFVLPSYVSSDTQILRGGDDLRDSALSSRGPVSVMMSNREYAYSSANLLTDLVLA